jgi:hypothetical protein
VRPPTASGGPLVRSVLAHRRAGAAVAATVLVVVAAVVAVLAVGGYRRSEVLLSSGTAWLPSPQGLVTLVDGPSDQVVGNVQAASGAGQAPAVVQLGTSALVVDQQAGTIARVDGATYAVTGPKSFGGGGPLQVLPGGKSDAFVVDGTHQQALLVDTATLATRRTLRLGVAPGPDQAVVDGSGTLWALDAGSGGLVRADASGTVSDSRKVGDGSSLLAASGGRPVLVDASGGRIGVIDGSGSVPTWACTGLKLGDHPRLLSADDAGLVYLALEQRGELLAADLAGRRCSTVPLAPAGTAFGRPVEDDGFVLVPDEALGQAIVVDAGRVVSREQVVPAGTTFELVAKDGLVFYNDLAGPLAGVVHLQGGEWVAGAPVAKFGSSAVPSLAAANSLVPSNDVQGLPPPPHPGAVTSRAAATTTPATGSGGTTTTSAPPSSTTTWPTTTWPTTTTPTETTPTETTPTETTPITTPPPSSPLPTFTFGPPIIIYSPPVLAPP